jgi:hypothetical protein
MRAVAAINPATEDFSVLDFDDKAFSDRFCHVKFEPSTQDWLKYAKKEQIHPSIISFITENNDMLKKETQDFNLEVDYTPRSWMAVNRILQNNPSHEILQELLIGLVGLEATGMYMDHLNKKDEKLIGKDVSGNFTDFKNIILKYSSDENNREDILKILNDDILEELKKYEIMPKEIETNLVNYITSIPKNLGYALVLDLYNVDSFISTESDPEFGLSGNPNIEINKNTESCKKLINHFKDWKKEEAR